VPSATPLVFHDHDQLEVPDAACQEPPSTWTDTLASEALSDAEPVTATVPLTVAPEAGLLIATVGAVVSAVVVELLTLTVTALVEALPEASTARAVTVCEPLVTLLVFHDQDQLEVPDAACQEPPSTWTDTLASDVLSDAEPATATVPATVEAFAGVLISTLGGVVSVEPEPCLPLLPVGLAAKAVVAPPAAIAASARDAMVARADGRGGRREAIEIICLSGGRAGRPVGAEALLLSGDGYPGLE
jgi:hypothetical protein